ncbi:MAG: 2-amino-4-hydroxy-6-hydroxymethyldihydropteridine diphosphokinase [Candidatus Omnitrophota bacterium]
MVTCYIGLGANLGEREKNISRALAFLREDTAIKVLQVSSVIETKPEGVSLPQPYFLNAVVKIKTSYTARQLLKKLRQIETKLGRPTHRPKNYPRTIDLDILLYGNTRIKEKNLEIPHPRIQKRQFVLKPLKEIAGELFSPEGRLLQI